MANFFSRLKLGAKFLVLVMILVSGIMAGVLYLVYSEQKRAIVQEVEARALDLTSIIAFSSVPALLENNYNTLQTYIDGLKNRPGLRQVMILDVHGKVLAHCNTGERDKVYADPLTRQVLQSNKPVVVGSAVWREENVLEVATPIFAVINQKVGVARAMISLRRTEQAIQTMMYEIWLIGFVATGVAFVLVAHFSRLVTHPLRQLDQKALQISRGERDIQIEITTRDEIGHLQQALKTMIDEVRLQSRLSALGSTTAHLAHEIRTPVAAIMRHIRELQSQAANAALGDKLLGEVNQLNDLIEQLLQFSQKKKLARSRTDVNDLLEQTLLVLETALQQKQIKIHRDLPDLPLISADKRLLQSVFTNLIQNAVDAMEAQGELSLQTKFWTGNPDEHWGRDAKTALPAISAAEDSATSAATAKTSALQKIKRRLVVETPSLTQRTLAAKFAPEKPAVMIVIRDNGSGIAQENLEQLFLPFFTTKKNGNGLGLALSHKIIQEHQGAISVDSQEGFGTTFTILLPA